jgi:hypothetical protein
LDGRLGCEVLKEPASRVSTPFAGAFDETKSVDLLTPLSREVRREIGGKCVVPIF